MSVTPLETWRFTWRNHRAQPRITEDLFRADAIFCRRVTAKNVESWLLPGCVVTQENACLGCLPEAGVFTFCTTFHFLDDDEVPE